MVQPLCRQLCAISLRQYTHPLFLQQMKGRVSEEDSLLAPFHISDRNVPSNVGQPKRIDLGSASSKVVRKLLFSIRFSYLQSSSIWSSGQLSLEYSNDDYRETREKVEAHNILSSPCKKSPNILLDKTSGMSLGSIRNDIVIKQEKLI